MSVGRAISLFLIDGVPDGRVACELFNWTGKGFRIPRRLIKESADRPELKKAGVYLLFGRDDATNEANAAYVGEAEEVIDRLRQHNDKEFWTEALVFVSKDENLNKAHVKYLEFTIHAAALTAGRYSLRNGNTPPRPAISEVEQAVMSEFFANLQLLTGAMGYKVFEPLISPATATSMTDEYQIEAARGAKARGVFGNDGMVVRVGSAAAGSHVPSTPDTYIRLRDLLTADGTLVAENGSLVFRKDHLFPSPSAAAAVILGRSANGWIEWKDTAGRTLKENEM